MNLTKQIIDKAVYEGAGLKKDVRWDDEVKGFGLRVYPSGKKTFVLFYRMNGRQRFMTLGAYGVLTLDQARRIAKVQLSEVIKGMDPLGNRQKSLRAETVGELCEHYIRDYAPLKKTGGEDIRMIKKYIRPAWSTHKVKSIQHSDVAFIHRKVGTASIYNANRLVALISKMWECARKWGVIERTADNPARGIDFFKEQKRDRWVKPEELPKIAKAIAEEPDPYVKAAIWLLIFTGRRKSELLTCRWEYVDLERGEINLPDSKNGKPIHLPLPKHAVAILERLPRQVGNPYVLCGREQGKHLVNISKPWVRIRTAAGVEDLRLHDLRRTLGSWLVQSGTPLNVVSRLLNHSDIRVTDAHYGHFAQDHLRAPLEQHSKAILKASKRKSTRLLIGSKNV